MKPMRYISLIIALLSVLGLAAQQQQSQYALYNYRNDGDFNAWLNIDVDSITYSNIGLDSVEYDNIVTQEVWTPDSCYRIPIEVIDSIGFRAPAPEFKDGIFLITEEHLPYIIAVDDESVTFSNDTPSLLMPYTGQIMYSDLTTEPFYMGFAGRIVELQTTEEGITYRCEPVSPSEVYNRYLNVFKVVTDPDNVLDPYTRPRHAPKRSIFGGIAEDGLITIPDIKIKFDTSLNKWAGCSGNVTIDAKISNSVEYVICVGMLDADFVNIKHTKKVNWSLGTSYKIEKFDDKEDSYEEWLDTPFFTWGCPWLGLNLYCGLFFDVKANLELIAKFPVYESTSVEEYYFGTDVGWTNPIVTQFNSGGWSSTRDEQIDALVDDTEVKVKLSGSISFGPVIKASFQVWKPNWLSFDVRAKGGLELSGECAMDLWALVHGEDVIYKTISEDTKITSGLKIALELHGTAMKKDCTFASVSRILFKTEHYLFPRFTQPAFPKYINGTWEGGVSPLSVYTVPSNNLLLPGKVGLSVYDELGNKISTSYESIWFFGGDWEKSWLQSDVSNLECGKTYIVRPFFRMLNINEVLASPSSQFTVPEPMTLDINTPLNSVTLGKGQEGFYAINGGWGEYSAHSSMKAICDAEIVMNNDKPYVKISASNRMTGPATVTVKDLRAGTTETILISVSDDEPVGDHEWVDLGLPSGTLWATCNVGANSPEEYGDYFAWGETEPNNIYDWIMYKWMNAGWSSWTQINKYTFADGQTEACWYSDGTFIGDNNMELDSEDDAATANWGSGWQMPSIDQMDELLNSEYTTTEWTTMSGVNGRKVTSKVNGNSIFLPAAGHYYDTSLLYEGSDGDYWSRSLSTIYSNCACGLGFYSRDIITSNNSSRYFGQSVRPVRIQKNDEEHEYVDLGLPSGTKWATCNVVANSPEEYGDYFAWGETAPKDEYNWSTYFDTDDGGSTFKKYNNNGGLTELQPADDAATANWGSGWQMPSIDQIEELINSDYTTTEWTTQGGVNGRLITSKSNGNSLFLPAAGYRYDTSLLFNAGSGGSFWSRSLFADDSDYACSLYFYSGDIDGRDSGRVHGRSVRPVRVQKNNEEHEYVDLGLPSGTKWATCNVGANSPEEYGDYFAWGETAPKDYYDWSTCFDTNDNGSTFKKYNRNGGWTELQPTDDAATKNWGSPWHMPTFVQMQELLDNCTREWTTQGGVNGILVTGPNGNTIFLPAAGYRWVGELDGAGSYGHYWSSALNPGYATYANYLIFGSGSWGWYSYGRGYGQSVRAVRP